VSASRKRAMEIALSQPAVRRAVANFTKAGAKSNCPFCKGRMIASVTSGERIILLQGMYSGLRATVSEPGWSDDEFLVHFDNETRDTLTRISYKRDRFAYFPIKKIPEWLCHLSIDDLSAVEESSLLTALNFAIAPGSKKWSNVLLPLIATIRSRRLPVLSADIWPTLIAHDFPTRQKADFCRFFDFGIDLLVSLNGRPAVQRKMMRPLSRGRYLTPGQEEYLGPSPIFTS
jgi:hypothetical protein